MFALNGPLSLAPGGAVELVVRDGNTELFDIDNGNIILRDSGMYYAALTVDVPRDVEVDTTMRLELDNRTLIPPQLAVTTSVDGTSNNFSGHTVFAANAGSVLRLSTQEFLNVHTATAQPLFTLTLIRL